MISWTRPVLALALVGLLATVHAAPASAGVGLTVTATWAPTGTHGASETLTVAFDMITDYEEISIRMEARSAGVGSHESWSVVGRATVPSEGSHRSATLSIPPMPGSTYTFRAVIRYAARSGDQPREATTTAHTYSWRSDTRPLSVRLDGPDRIRTTVGKRLQVSGVVDGGDVAQRRVVLRLETRRGDGQEVATAVTGEGGHFDAVVPTHWHYDRRLTASVGSVRSSAVQVSVAGRDYAPRGRATSFRVRRIATWNACTPIGYRVNPVGMPPGGRDLLAGAFAELTRATGFRFRYDGPTSVLPWAADDEQHFDNRTELTIGWSNASIVPGLAGVVAGLGGGAVSLGKTYLYAGVVFDLDKWVLDFPRRERQDLLEALALHELGHAMGLRHVHDPDQIMNDTLLPSQRSHYEAGDLAGLRRIGSERFSCDLPVTGTQRVAAIGPADLADLETGPVFRDVAHRRRTN